MPCCARTGQTPRSLRTGRREWGTSDEEGHTLRLMFFSLPSPSSFLSNLPIDAVAVLVTIRSRSITTLRSLRSIALFAAVFCCAALLRADLDMDEEAAAAAVAVASFAAARCWFLSCCVLFLSNEALRASLDAATGSKFGSDPTVSPARRRRAKRTLVLGHLDDPLVLDLLVLPLVPPLGHPVLLLVVKHQAVSPRLGSDSLCRCECLPLGHRRRLGELARPVSSVPSGRERTHRLLARKGGRNGRKGSDESVVGNSGRLGPDGVDEELDTVPGVGEQRLLLVGSAQPLSLLLQGNGEGRTYT